MNFPSSPALNQTYSSGGRTWRWTGVAWAIVPVNLSTLYVDLANNQTVGGEKTFQSNVTVQGNLIVTGNTVSVNSTTLEVSDPILTVGKNNDGSVPFMGIKAERGSTDAFWVFEEASDKWAAYTSSDNLSTKSSSGVEASQFSATVTTGTAPFVTTSTTLNTNFNADLLDSQEGSFYRNASNLNAGTLSDDRLPISQGPKILSTTPSLTPLDTSSWTSGIYVVDGGNDTSVVPEQFCVLANFSLSNTRGGQLTFGNNSLYFRRIHTSNTNFPFIKLWSETNDGTGSGLDADLLDGQQGSYYTSAANLTGTVPGAALPAFTGDATKASGGTVLTLATVNSNVGAFGSNAAVPIITVNGKGLITAVSTAALGNAAVQTIGTSGATVPLLNGTNTWSGVQKIATNAATPLTIERLSGTANLNIEFKTASHNRFFGITPDGVLRFGNLSDLSSLTDSANLVLKGTADASYLGIGATAVNSDLLDGQHGSYYENASNIVSGTLSDARLPSSQTGKTFTGNVAITSGAASTSTVTGALVVTGGVGISGSLNAATKSFSIPHPTKPNMTLRYGSLEGPEFGVYIRGRLKDSSTIILPDYWVELVDPDTITVSLTPVGKSQRLFVEKIENNTVYVKSDGFFQQKPDCFFVIFGERKDVDKLEVEV